MPPATTVSAAAYYLPGMLAAGVLLSGLQNMAVDIAVEKGDGTLKRLAGTPLSVISYFIGKIGQVLVTGLLQAALLLLVARFAFGVELPTDPASWLTFAWVFLLGVTTCAILGHRAQRPAALGQERDGGHHPDRARAAVHLGRLPRLLEPAGVAAERRERLPAEVARAGHALGLPALDRSRRAEAGGSWNLPGVAIVTGIWLVVGLVAGAADVPLDPQGQLGTGRLTTRRRPAPARAAGARRTRTHTRVCT